MKRASSLLWSVVVLVAMGAASVSSAAEVRVAVAANFTEPAREIAKLFEVATGHKATLSFGATGQFYGQIMQGAPFEILLSADKATPAKAVAEGFAVAGSAFTYATGRLVLFSATAGKVTGADTLKSGQFEKIAIANPSTAPYGAAAIEVMKKLGVQDALQPKIVTGQNIGQTFQFVETGNAEIGFVALSQVVLHDKGSRWIVPRDLHAPIFQDVVLLKRGADSAAAKAFLAFLKSETSRTIIERFGYSAGE